MQRAEPAMTTLAELEAKFWKALKCDMTFPCRQMIVREMVAASAYLALKSVASDALAHSTGERVFAVPLQRVANAFRFILKRDKPAKPSAVANSVNVQGSGTGDMAANSP